MAFAGHDCSPRSVDRPLAYKTRRRPSRGVASPPMIVAFGSHRPRIDPTAFVPDAAVVIGDVTVGHNAVLHGCTVEDGCLIGMGAIVLDGAVVGARSLVGARALVTPGTVIPPQSLVLGSPAQRVRALNDAELERLRVSAANYVALVQRYREAS